MNSRSPRSAWGSRSQREGAAMSRWSRASRSAHSSSTQPSVPAQQGRAQPPSAPARGGAERRDRLAEPQQRAQVEAEATPEVRGPLAGDPLALALPTFIVGSVALGMVLVGFVTPVG